MKAYRFSDWKTPAELLEVPVPEPGPGEALIKIGGAGACHSDLHLMHDWTPELVPSFAGWQLPFTIGHENAGWIEGGETNGIEVGAPVVLSPTWCCNRCRSCRLGATNYCENPNPLGSGGLGRDGGMAEYMVAPSHCLIRLNKLAPADAAPLTDAGLTSYHAVKLSLPLLTPDTTAVVIGVGGLGHLAVEFLRVLTGTKIIAVDVDEEARDMAAERGADFCLDSNEETHAQIMNLTGGLGAISVFDFVGIDATMTLAVKSVRRMGKVTIVGIGGGVVPLRYTSLPPGCSIGTTIGGSTQELAEVVALAEAGRINPHTTRFALNEVDSVYEQLHQSKIKGRAVIIP